MFYQILLCGYGHLFRIKILIRSSDEIYSLVWKENECCSICISGPFLLHGVCVLDA